MTKIGFIGQGWIGRHMADDFENRDYETVRYSLEEPYVKNKAGLADCEIVFIAVPTPTVNKKFDYSPVESALSNLKPGTTAVVKSTILPGTTEALQQKFTDLFVMHSPEFLREKTAAEDTAHPERNIVGIPNESPEFYRKAETVLAVLPDAPHSAIMSARSAECIKYIGNTFLYTKLLFMNIAYDFAMHAGADWDMVREMVGNDSRIGHSHTQPIHESGRGAGGHCFIKDFEAFTEYNKDFVDTQTFALLDALRTKNNQLLVSTKKDLDLLTGVYGPDILEQDF
jgi:UDPglucose 6-dehydrogenase